MTPEQPYQTELNALRDLEKAIRACGLPAMMVSGQKQLESLVQALNDVEEARKTSTKFSR
jgi:hypothetical protein